MDILYRGWHWLGDEPSALVILAAAVFAVLLLTAFAAAARRLEDSRRPATVRDGKIAGHDAATARLESVEVEHGRTVRSRGSRRLQRRVSLLSRRLRRSRKIRDNLLFFSRFASAPLKVGSVAPSSRRLGRAMAAELPADYGICVELGGGTGSLTRALLAAGMPRDRLIVIERDPRLAAHLRSRFRGVKVLQGDAQELRRLLRAEGIDRVDAVISSLPLRSLPNRVCQAILAESFEALVEGGIYVQYTYGLTPPVAERIAAGIRIDGEARTRVWRNLPPAVVWRYSRAAA